ncbi:MULTISPECIES: hypothetical protein [unclassified Leifsonia]|uniref:hypothetical protein n=1 Tax=unclassified Leifsonia TaxID=2663824 RepID=UPI000A193505|nr:hypothetical protein [Leifsonia sp. NCR5]
MGKAIRSSLAVSAAIIAAVALAGCTSGPAPSASPSPTQTKAAQASNQTHDAACAIVKGGLTDVASLQSQVSTDDPAKSLAVLDQVDQKVADLDAKVTNEKVKALTSDASTAVHAYATYLKGVMKDPASIDVNQITSKAQELAAKFTAVQKECA